MSKLSATSEAVLAHHEVGKALERVKRIPNTSHLQGRLESVHDELRLMVTRCKLGIQS